jgi:hypothetical protein
MWAGARKVELTTTEGISHNNVLNLKLDKEFLAIINGQRQSV